MAFKIKTPIKVEFDAPITLAQAKALTAGTVLYSRNAINADGTPRRWVITSVKIWKRDPNRLEVGLKHGLYAYDRAHSLYDLNEYLAVGYTEVE